LSTAPIFGERLPARLADRILQALDRGRELFRLGDMLGRPAANQRGERRAQRRAAGRGRARNIDERRRREQTENERGLGGLAAQRIEELERARVPDFPPP
jgi:hypothetical protein